jgi:KUP system potassium uptake protein
VSSALAPLNRGLPRNPLITLTIGALGVVYGDIGTSPLYALRESFEGAHHIDVTETNVLGVLSLIFWSLLVVITLKYLSLVMRADSHGEGGILALFSLIDRDKLRRHAAHLTLAIGLFGTALLYGDGMITPAISVLSAVEGFEVATDAFSPYVVPIAIVILIGLFAIQRHGTGAVGRVFGPVMIIWFLTLGGLGIHKLLGEPRVLKALSPSYAVEFFAHNSLSGFLALGSIFLVVTGAEALYADMGHFGRRPIGLGWYCLVFPCLTLTYLGQGALLIDEPDAIENPFYKMAPAALVVPLAVLATMATIIASQALISGAFSLTAQAISLGYCPRLRVLHTSEHERGQVYVPIVNWALLVACIGLVLGFRTSSNLAAAYGVAVTATMAITTILLFLVMRQRWNWSLGAAGAVCASLLVVDLAFLGANLFKIPDGGWFPLLIGLIIFTLLTTWKTGRVLLGQAIKGQAVPLSELLTSFTDRPAVRVTGTAVYLSSNLGLAPPPLLANLRSNHVLHERVVLLTVYTEDRARTHPVERLTLTHLGQGFTQAVIRVGFKEQPDIPGILASSVDPLVAFRPEDTTYFVGGEEIVSTDRPGMARWRERLFSIMSRNASAADRYFGLPHDRVFEIEQTVEI